jgi:hypothetical protein
MGTPEAHSRQLADRRALAQAWPGWKIWASQPADVARLYATRRTRLTDEQLARGLEATVDADTDDELVTALKAQRSIEMTYGWHEHGAQATP